MTIPIGEDDLMAWIDGRLPPERRSAVDGYLAAHPEEMTRLRAQADQRQRLIDTFAPVAAEPIPAGMRLTAITARQRPSSGWWQTAVAALLLTIGFGGGWGLHDRMAQAPRRGIAALAQEATDSYRVYASDIERPIELGAGDRAQLVRWMSTRLGGRVAIPDLTSAGYRFMGGRLVATGHGPAALFLYNGFGASRLAVLTRPMEVDKTARMAATTEGNIDRVSWADNGRGYSVVGTLQPTQLRAIANHVRLQVSQT